MVVLSPNKRLRMETVISGPPILGVGLTAEMVPEETTDTSRKDGLCPLVET